MVALPVTGGWNFMVLGFPSSPSHSMIPCRVQRTEVISMIRNISFKLETECENTAGVQNVSLLWEKTVCNHFDVEAIEYKKGCSLQFRGKHERKIIFSLKRWKIG